MTVLLASTDTPEGSAARTFAVEEATRRSEELLVFHLESGGTADTQGSWGDGAEGPAVRHVRSDDRARDAVGEFLDLANEGDVSVAVIGVRARSPIGKFFLGSQAQRILLESRCPVVAVKA